MQRRRQCQCCATKAAAAEAAAAAGPSFSITTRSFDESEGLWWPTHTVGHEVRCVQRARDNLRPSGYPLLGIAYCGRARRVFSRDGRHRLVRLVAAQRWLLRTTLRSQVYFDSQSSTYTVMDSTFSIQRLRSNGGFPLQGQPTSTSCVQTCCQQIRRNSIPVK